MKYTEINPKVYAENLRKKFLENPTLWYDVVLPKEKADELKRKTNNDYSKIWHEHCDLCWETLDTSTDVCYQGEDGISWLCKNCYQNRQQD